jgi:hypothetical protein
MGLHDPRLLPGRRIHQYHLSLVRELNVSLPVREKTRPGVPRSPGLVAPVVATVVMNERPAPRCKRRSYRCAPSASPIRTSTVRDV